MTEYTNCPDCSMHLGKNRMRCRCGWVMSHAESKPRADCAWEGCRQKAVLRDEIEPGEGLRNLCEYHYLEAHKTRAKRWCEENGLVTVQQKKEFCRKLLRVTLKPMLEREPGQDDEEHRSA